MLALKIIGFIIILGIFIYTAFKFPSSKMPELNRVPELKSKKGLIVGLLSIIVYLMILPSVGMIQTGSQGVVLHFGAFTGKTLGEGIYFVKPLFETVEVMNTQVVKKEAEAHAGSKDLQEVRTDITVNYSLMPQEVGNIYRSLRRDYEIRVVDPTIQEAVKAVTARFDAENLIVERPLVKEGIETYLKAKLEPYGIIVHGVAITNFAFSPEFAKAIERKVVATQNALESQRTLEKVRWDADQAREKARGEAEAMLKIAEASAKAKLLQGDAEAKILAMQKANATKELVALRNVEAQLRAIEKWDGAMPSVITGNGPVPILDVFQPVGGAKE